MHQSLHPSHLTLSLDTDYSIDSKLLQPNSTHALKPGASSRHLEPDLDLHYPTGQRWTKKATTTVILLS